MPQSTCSCLVADIKINHDTQMRVWKQKRKKNVINRSMLPFKFFLPLERPKLTDQNLTSSSMNLISMNSHSR